MQAYACLPLLNQGRVIGTLSFGSLKRQAFSDEDLGLIHAVADQVAIAMQRIRLMRSLEQRAAEAQSANVAKSQFLASMSHELRTPMNAVLGMTDLALSEDLTPAVRDYIDTARESASVLLELLNDILDLSRIEAGKLKVEAAPFHLRSLLDKTVKSLGVRAYEKGIELLYNVADDVPDHLVGDALRVRQVLTNLVGNAIKFTHKGEIAVRVAVRSRSDGEVCLEFSVQDTGIGISPEDQQTLFVPFEQAEADRRGNAAAREWDCRSRPGWWRSWEAASGSRARSARERYSILPCARYWRATPVPKSRTTGNCWKRSAACRPWW